MGIVAFFLTAALSAVTVRVDLTPWVLVYFGLALVAISLARIEEAGQERPLGWKWAAVLAVSILATLFLGLVATRLLTLDTVNAFFALFAPLAIVVEILAFLVAIPLLFVFELLARLLTPVLNALSGLFRNLFPEVEVSNDQVSEFVAQVARQIESFAPYIRLVTVILVVLFVAWLVARALRRRIEWAEREMFEAEEVDDLEANLVRRKRTRPSRPVHHEIHAENVRRIYAALQAHAAAYGLERSQAETPLEYLPRLSARFPGAADGLGEITLAYMAVHYAQRPASEEQVRSLRAVWQGVKAHMTTEAKRHKARAK